MTPTTAPPFSAQLRAATAPEHQAAESEPFVSALLEGRLSASAFADLVAQQWVVYDALENAFAACDHPALQPFLDPALARVPALRADMAYHFGVGWRRRLGADVPVLPAAVAYADTVVPDVTYLLAHHYVRYLGDLSGGQVIARLVQRHYGVPDAGLHFYDFAQLGKAKTYKDAYRQRLDVVALSEGERDAVLHHARQAFECTRRVFVELADLHAPVPVG